jgi:hypothetical protein
MEEEDGVPLSYPHPAPAPALAPAPVSVSSSSPCLALQQHAGTRYEKSPPLGVRTTRTARGTARTSASPSSPIPAACTDSARTLHPQLGHVQSTYGARGVQSTAAEAAVKWKAARLASSKKSLLVSQRFHDRQTTPPHI